MIWQILPFSLAHWVLNIVSPLRQSAWAGMEENRGFAVSLSEKIELRHAQIA